MPDRISIDEAKRVADLARIHVEDEELPGIADDLENMLEFMEQLNEVDVEGVNPMVSVTPMKLPLRKDIVETGGNPEEILSNAPNKSNGLFEVPKMIE